MRDLENDESSAATARARRLSAPYRKVMPVPSTLLHSQNLGVPASRCRQRRNTFANRADSFAEAAEGELQIVGIERTNRDGTGVETIDIWFSERRRRWIVERLDAEGHQIGLAYVCDSEGEAEACLGEWLRTHAETRMTALHRATPAEKKILATAHRHAA